MIIVDIITYLFLAIGSIFNILAAIGVHRFPDVYNRLHASGKCATFGSIFTIAAVVVKSLGAWVIEGPGSSQQIIVIHALIALAAILLTSPTSTHAIARSAHRSGVKPTVAVTDDLEKEKL